MHAGSFTSLKKEPHETMRLEKPLDNLDKGLPPAPPLCNTNRVLEPEGSEAPHLSIEPNSMNKLVLVSILVQRCLMLQ